MANLQRIRDLLRVSTLQALQLEEAQSGLRTSHAQEAEERKREEESRRALSDIYAAWSTHLETAKVDVGLVAHLRRILQIQELIVAECAAAHQAARERARTDAQVVAERSAQLERSRLVTKRLRRRWLNRRDENALAQTEERTSYLSVMT